MVDAHKQLLSDCQLRENHGLSN